MQTILRHTARPELAALPRRNPRSWTVLVLLAGAVLWLQPAIAQTTGGGQIGSVLEGAGKGKVKQPALKQHPSGEIRSAQSDCVREANRRGYSVIDTSNFQKSRDGWSIDLAARDRRGRAVSGTCFVYRKSNEVSLYGFGWDDDDWKAQDRMEFVCASVDSRYRECQLPVNGRARVVKRLSDASCIEGKSYGQRGDRVWVDDGCRARFEVTRAGGGGGDSNAGIIQCFSDDKRYKECRVGPGYTARLVRDLSKNRCQRDSTWGTRNGVVWVTAGCRGEFQRVRGSGGFNNGGGAGGLQPGAVSAATTACANEARRLKLGVSQQYAPRQVPGGYRVDMYVRTGRGEMRNAVCSYSFGTGRARIDTAD